jgi:hypothetical protein
MDPEIFFGLMVVLALIVMTAIVFVFRHIYQTRSMEQKSPAEFNKCYSNCIVDSKRDPAASCAALCS